MGASQDIRYSKLLQPKNPDAPSGQVVAHRRPHCAQADHNHVVLFRHGQIVLIFQASLGLAAGKPPVSPVRTNRTRFAWNRASNAGEVPNPLDLIHMLHDTVMSRISGMEQHRLRHATEPATEAGPLPGTVCDDRRVSDRLPFPAEMILVWNHDLQTPLRYQVIDAGDGGYRIHCSSPLLEGTTGMVIRLLPGRGRQMAQPVKVAWSRQSELSTGFEAGLRCF